MSSILNSVLLLLLINCDLVINDKCTLCDTKTNIACITTNSYQFCKNAANGTIPNPELGTHVCTGYKVCDSSSLMGCVIGKPSCDDICGRCNPRTNIACVNQKNFTVCQNSNIINKYGYPCPGNLVCNSASNNWCIDPTIGPTCTDPVYPTDPKEFCTSQINLVIPGRYGIKGECRKYNYCYKFQGNRTGIQLECLGRTNFNCNTHQCEVIPCGTC